MQEQTIANDILFAYAERELRAGRKVRVRLVGYSMMPTLNPATDTLCIAPATSAPRLYDVVLAKLNGQYILHRLIKKTADGWLMKGDANNTAEHIADNDIIGLLAAAERHGQAVNFTKMTITTNINDIDARQWDSLLQASRCGGFFQSRQCYHFYASTTFLKPFVVAVSQNGVLKGVMVGYIQRDGGRIKQYFSRRAIINGGPLLADDISTEALAALLTASKEHLRGKAIYVEIRNFFDYSAYKEVFAASGFSYQPHYNIQSCTAEGKEMLDQLGRSAKRNVKISLRDGASIVENPTIDQVREYYAILDELYRTKVHSPLFPLSFFETLYHTPGAHFLLVRYEEKIVGGVVCVGLEGKALYEWFACGEDGVHKNIRPSSVAKYAGLNHAAQNGFALYDMMGAGAPDDGGYGVRDFKLTFGGTLVEPGRYLCLLNAPLYQLGKLAIKIMKR